MRMLDNLEDKLADIELDSEWEYNFVQDLITRKAQNPDYKLSKKQFKKLSDIHEKYR